jgi:hypothetical protein
MGQIIWNIEIDENTKLNVGNDGTAMVIHTNTVRISDLPPEYLARIVNELQKKLNGGDGMQTKPEAY